MQYLPKVEATQEFIEIANDFSNPLEIVREAISNSFDANAQNIEILFDMVKISGRQLLQITLTDDGLGMNIDELHSFFNLGDSTKRDQENIGEKGHGTKVYFNSTNVKVETCKDGKAYSAEMNDPYTKLSNREIPEVEILEIDPNFQGTKITVLGYNNNHRDRFTQEILKDYIYWFTKFGSPEKEFGIKTYENVKLKLKGLNAVEPEELVFGHIFPQETSNINKLFDDFTVDAPNRYCKKIIKQGHLKNSPELSYQAIFMIEGNKVKTDYNKMIRHAGYVAPTGSYTVQERYGLWLCKDFIPIQRKNEWIAIKGSEYTRFHAFFNCQGLKLTANRGSTENTPQEILEDIRSEVKKIFDSILEGDDWRFLDWLSEEADGYRTMEKEKRDYKYRIDQVNKANTCVYKEHELIEPRQENGVFSLFMLLDMLEPKLFNFSIVDYDTHEGIDVLVKSKNDTALSDSKVFYVEFKYILSGKFNNCFDNVHTIVCWDIKLKNDDTVQDLCKEERKLSIAKDNGIRRYFLDNSSKARKIEIIVLKDFIKDKLKLEFRPRTSDKNISS